MECLSVIVKWAYVDLAKNQDGKGRGGQHGHRPRVSGEKRVRPKKKSNKGCLGGAAKLTARKVVGKNRIKRERGPSRWS